ncbi:MAG: ABC transporter ATP-binding protein [Rubrivivax sp.]|nr:ABC transporter ATP-binding protein [Rubrivivax sp.]
MLEVNKLAVTYGQHRALKGVDLSVKPGEIVVMLGANGAGKTSLLKAVAGLIPADAGSQVRLDGHALSGQPPHHIVEAGLALVPEGRGIFGDLSVQENLVLGAFAQRARIDQAANLDRVLGLFPKLAERSAQIARTMSGGEQQMVAIGRALMSAPTILMLDEPSLGLSPLLCSELFKALQAVRATGVGILLVEQNARQSLAIADRAYLLENGQIVGQGPAAQLARDPAVQAAYLGGAAAKTGAARAHTAARAMAPAHDPAAIAAQALAAVARTGGYGTPGATTSADTLVPVRIADLVRVASQRQAQDVEAQRHAPAAPANPALAQRALAELQAAGTLDAAVAQLEAAVQRLKPTPVVAPTLEVWRRPGIEIHRRQADGSFKKDD